MSKPNFRGTILKQRIDALRLRIFSGDNVDLATDGAKLVQMREQARQLGDTDLELFAINVYGVLHFTLGKVNDAQRIYEEGASLALRWDNMARWINFQLNLGSVHSGRGDLKAARAAWESLLPAFRSVPLEVEAATRQCMVLVNLAGVCVQLGDYAAAEQYAQRVLSDWDTPIGTLIRPERRPELMARVREALASLYFARGQYDLARAQTELLNASQRGAPLLPLATAAQLLFVRLAVFDPADPTSPETRWQAFSDSIAPGVAARDRALWVLGKVDLLSEARFYQERGKLDWARRCAEKAVEILTALDDEEHRREAEALLAKFPANG